MNKSLIVLVVALGLCIPSFARAEEPPHLKFIKGLRDKQFTDVAESYIQSLIDNPTLVPKELVPLLPLEKAKLNVDLAMQAPDATRRADLLKSARDTFGKFADSNKDNPLGARARFEAARALSLEGRDPILRARLQLQRVDVATLDAASKKLELAKRELDALELAITGLLGTPLQPAQKQDVLELKDQLILEKGINQIDQAAAYEVLQRDGNKRIDFLEAAQKSLLEFSGQDPRTPAQWEARAWAVQAFLDMARTTDVQREVAKIMGDRSLASDSAKRMARYSSFLELAANRTGKTTPAELQKVGEDWLRLYPGHHNTPEGNRLRYQLANSFYAQADQIPKKGKDEIDLAKAGPIFENARKLYQGLTAPINEYTTVATHRAHEIEEKLNPAGVPESVDKIKTFSQAIRVGQAYKSAYERKEREASEKKQLKELTKLREQYYKDAIGVYAKAVELKDATVPPTEVADVYAKLSYLNFVTNEPYKAAVLGDFAARTYPDAPQSAGAAASAIQAYAKLMAEGRAAGQSKDDLQVDRDRLLSLTRLMEKQWPADPGTNGARYYVGRLLLTENDYREGEAFLSRITDNLSPKSLLLDARYYWAVAAQKMLEQPKLLDGEKQHYRDQLLAAQLRMPKPAADATAQVIEMYVKSKLQLGQFLYKTGDFNKLKEQADDLTTALGGFNQLSEALRKDYKQRAESLLDYARYGQANDLVNAVQAKQAYDAVEPLFRQLQGKIAREQELKTQLDKEANAQKKAALSAELELVRQQVPGWQDLRRGAAIVKVRALVLQGQYGPARIELDELPKMEGGSNVGPTYFVQIAAQINKQIKDLRAAPQKKAQLDQVVSTLTAFLDSLDKYIATAKEPSPELIFFLVNCYSMMDQHENAGRCLGKVLSLKPGKDLDAARLETLQREAMVMQATEYRKGKTKENLKKAEEIVDQLVKTEWGKKSLSLEWERGCLFEAQEKFGPAAMVWQGLVDKFGKLKNTNLRFKDQYNEAYYHFVHCLTFYKQYRQGAQRILDLEKSDKTMGGDDLKERYRMLLATVKELKAEYDRIKAAAAKSS